MTRLGGRADLANMAGSGAPCPEGKPLKALPTCHWQVSNSRLLGASPSTAVESRNPVSTTHEAAIREMRRTSAAPRHESRHPPSAIGRRCLGRASSYDRQRHVGATCFNVDDEEKYRECAGNRCVDCCRDPYGTCIAGRRNPEGENTEGGDAREGERSSGSVRGVPKEAKGRIRVGAEIV